MASSSRYQVLSLYRMLLKESKKFPSYNFRMYALRRVRDGFRANHSLLAQRPFSNICETVMREATAADPIIPRKFC
ncbi:LYR motif-containing protein 4-like [Arapaima gigas]